MAIIPDKSPENEELSADELASLDRDALVKRCMGLQRAYYSLYNAVTLYKRQLSAVREHTLKSGQIADLSRKVNITDINIISDVAVRDLALFFEAEYGALLLYDSESKLLTLHKAYPEPEAQPALDLEHDDDVMTVHLLKTRREPIVIESLRQYEAMAGREFRTVPVEEPLAKGGLLCPLVVSMQDEERMTVGALLFGQKEGGFGRHDAEVATMMTEMIATAISTSRLIQQMSVLAETDGLTGLYNHRHFQQELDRALATARRYEQSLTLAMIDIDRFKLFNDRFGHQAGDHVLREVARLIRQSVRDTVDVVARYGGEEFAVIMPSTDLNGAEIAMERLRACVESARMQIGGEAVTVTISIGLAEYDKNAEKGAFVDAADMALYRAKREGRNRVELAHPEQFG